MLSSLRLGALLFVSANAEMKTSLKVTRKSGPASNKKAAVASLMESAKGFLKNGATPDVVTFAQETLTEVTSIVIPAIGSASTTDQEYIHQLHDRFPAIKEALALANQDVALLNTEETGHSTTHTQCRADEAVTCDGKRDCEMELWRLWKVWEFEEERLREYHSNIDDHFCPPGVNGTLHSFRVGATPMMTVYMAQVTVVNGAEEAYDAYRPQCIVTHGALDSKSAICNSEQSDLEDTSCSHAIKIREVVHDFITDYEDAEDSYETAVNEVKILEEDRKNEYVTLKVVECLLNRVYELNGVPCDQENGVEDAERECQTRHVTLEVCAFEPTVNYENGVTVTTEFDSRILCIDYPPVPPQPPLCPARDQVVGECLPVPQPWPCNANYDSQEYASLPLVPQSPFSETNPGCNQYPDCSVCDAMQTQTHSTGAAWRTDSDRTYEQPATVDGCATSNAVAGEHPLTVQTDRAHLADVRCCSMDGSTCESQNLRGGEQYFHNNDDVAHSEGCVTEVTFYIAHDICQAGGMRLCNSDEVQVCCGTGCYHDHHSIWVDEVAGDHHVAHQAVDRQVAQAGHESRLDAAGLHLAQMNGGPGPRR